MITMDEVRTICAALRFWEEEMCPHGPGVVQAYFEPGEIKALSSKEVHALQVRLATASLRFAVVDLQADQIENRNMFKSRIDAKTHCLDESHVVAAILIPAAEN